MSLPPDVVRRYNGSRMAISQYHIDVVRSDGYEESVPLPLNDVSWEQFFALNMPPEDAEHEQRMAAWLRGGGIGQFTRINPRDRTTFLQAKLGSYGERNNHPSRGNRALLVS